MSRAMKVVIIGGVAAGPKVASRIIRLMPDAEVTIVEKGKLLSYAGCGLPYYVSGVVKEQAELMSTPVGVVRDPVFFQKVKNVHVMNQTEAVKVDRAGKRVQVKDVNNGEESWLDYDKLVFATGAAPVVPPIPNIELENIFTLHGVHDAEGIKALLVRGKGPRCGHRRRRTDRRGGHRGARRKRLPGHRRRDASANPRHAGLGNRETRRAAHGIAWREGPHRHQEWSLSKATARSTRS